MLAQLRKRAYPGGDTSTLAPAPTSDPPPPGVHTPFAPRPEMTEESR